MTKIRPQIHQVTNANSEVMSYLKSGNHQIMTDGGSSNEATKETMGVSIKIAASGSKRTNRPGVKAILSAADLVDRTNLTITSILADTITIDKTTVQAGNGRDGTDQERTITIKVKSIPMRTRRNMLGAKNVVLKSVGS